LLDLPPEDPDRAAAMVVKPGDQRKESRLARAIEAEQHGTVAAAELEGHLAQGLALAERVAQPRDGEWQRLRICGLCFEVQRCALHRFTAGDAAICHSGMPWFTRWTPPQRRRPSAHDGGAGSGHATVRSP